MLMNSQLDSNSVGAANSHVNNGSGNGGGRGSGNGGNGSGNGGNSNGNSRLQSNFSLSDGSSHLMDQLAISGHQLHSAQGNMVESVIVNKEQDINSYSTVK